LCTERSTKQHIDNDIITRNNMLGCGLRRVVLSTIVMATTPRAERLAGQPIKPPACRFGRLKTTHLVCRYERRRHRNVTIVSAVPESDQIPGNEKEENLEALAAEVKASRDKEKVNFVKHTGF
jgi:hypothetical protein